MVCFLLIGIFSFSNIDNYASAIEYGGMIYVGKNTTFNLTGGTISGGTADYGGGVYVDGTFNMSGGTIKNNSALNGWGADVYCDSGTFTMTGGVVGTSSNGGIYNVSGTLNLYGGTVYNSIYSETTINTKMSANLECPICISNAATIVVQDYAGVTPEYEISFFMGARTDGTVITFLGNTTTEPDLSKISINSSQYDHDTYELVTVKDSSGNWTVALQEMVKEFDFPSDWKTQVASSTYMTTTVTPANLTSIKFIEKASSDYTKIGTLSTGLPVYQCATSTEIAFVGGKISTTYSCKNLFDGLSKLTSIDFKVFDTSAATDMTYMFKNCSSLSSLDLSGFDTSNVSNMDFVFLGCSSLTNITQNFDTSKVLYMRQMFYGCTKLINLDMSNFNTSRAFSLYGMFYNCSSLTTLDVSNFITSNVSDMGSMFDGCSSLTTLDVSKFNTSNVTNMRFMFFGCTSLTSLDVSSFDTSKVTNMSSMFYKCSKLTSLNVGNFNTSKVTTMSGMFSDCSSLTGLDVSGFNTSNVTSFNGMFSFCSRLTSVDVSNFNTSKVTDMGNMFLYCSSLKSLDVSKFDTSNVTDMSQMFRDCSSLTSLDVSNFNTSKVTNMRCMFYSLNNLKSLDVTNFNTTNVTNMSGMFGSCSALTSLDLRNFDTANVTDMSTMFHYCYNLSSLDVSSFNTSKATTMSTMFSKCTKLTTLNLSNFNTSNVTNIMQMFDGCTKLTSLNLSSFDTSSVSTMANMFRDCSSLSSLNLSSFVTSKVFTMAQMFRNCSSLTTLDLSSFDMTKVTSYSDMLNFGSANKIATFKTPYNNSAKLPITTGSTLYDTATGSVVTVIPANASASKTYAVKVALTFDANGGTCDTSTLSVYYGIKLSDQNVTLPTASKTGFSFDGWYESTTSTVKYLTTSIFTSATTLYARYMSSTISYVEFNETECGLLEHYFKYGEDSSSVGSIGNLSAMEITAIAFLSDFKNSIDAYTRLSESKFTSSGEFQFYLGTPTTDKFRTLMGETVLIIAPASCDGNTYISFPAEVNLDLLINTFSSYTALDLRGWSAKNFDNEGITIPSNVLVAILPQDIGIKKVYIMNSETKVYRYTGAIYTKVIQMFDAPSRLESNDFELVKTFVLCKNKNSIQTVLKINDEKLLETKRKIKIVSNMKKE